MKTHPSSKGSRIGSSWMEVVVVIAVLAFGAMMVLPALPRKHRHAHPIACVNNLKQIGTAFRLYANDYDGKYPHAVSNLTDAAVSGGDPTALLPWTYFQMAGNEISSPRILVCPADADRTPAQDFNVTNLTTKSFSHPSQRLKALSYFYGLSAREDDPNQLVTGDRNLTDGGTDTNPTKTLLTGRTDLADLLSNPKKPNLRWSTGLHDKGGNVGFSDGHVEQLTSGKLREAAATATASLEVKTNIIWLPNFPQPKR